MSITPAALDCPVMFNQATTLKPSRGLFASLFRAYWKRIILSYLLANLENLLQLAQPLALGLAIDGLLSGSWDGLLVFIGQHIAYTVASMVRRVYDARAFRTMATDVASQLVLQQRQQEVPISCVAARSALARELVSFFEREIAVILHAVYAVVGAVIMLCFYDWLLAPLCLTLVAPVLFLSYFFGCKTLFLNRKLNDELEHEVEVITGGEASKVEDHYGNVARWRICLTDTEALNFSITEVFILCLMAAALVRLCSAQAIEVGQIVAVFRYVLMFVLGLDSVPLVVQQLSRLRDIGRRLQG